DPIPGLQTLPTRAEFFQQRLLAVLECNLTRRDSNQIIDCLNGARRPAVAREHVTKMFAIQAHMNSRVVTVTTGCTADIHRTTTFRARCEMLDSRLRRERDSDSQALGQLSDGAPELSEKARAQLTSR